MRGNHLYNHHYSASDGAGLFLSSSSDLSQGPQWTPPAIQEISIEDYETTKRRGNTIYNAFAFSFVCTLHTHDRGPERNNNGCIII